MKKCINTWHPYHSTHPNYRLVFKYWILFFKQTHNIISKASEDLLNQQIKWTLQCMTCAQNALNAI